MHFMSEISNLGKKGNPALWLQTKEVDSRFIIHLLSFNSNEEIVSCTRLSNKYIYKIRESLLRKLLWLDLPKFDKNNVFKGYIKKVKEVEEPEVFKAKAKKYWKWSEKEWRLNSPILFADMDKLKYYAAKFGLEDKEIKKLGIVEKVPMGLDKW